MTKEEYKTLICGMSPSQREVVDITVAMAAIQIPMSKEERLERAIETHNSSPDFSYVGSVVLGDLP